MATHSSILAWKNLWIKEPDRLQSMGSEGDNLAHNLEFSFIKAVIIETAEI